MRKTSWALGVASILLPLAFAILQLKSFKEWAAAQGGMVCGMPVLGILFVALVGYAVLSLAATGTSVLAYRRDSSARALARKAEVLVLSAPLVASGVLMLLFVYAPSVLFYVLTRG